MSTFLNVVRTMVRSAAPIIQTITHLI